MNITRADQKSLFDTLRKVDNNGREYWCATELLTLLDYKTWRRQKDTVKRAMMACENSGNVVDNHFANVDQIQKIGDSGGSKVVTINFKLTRYACYLVAMNGDPRKKMVALAQSYFAVKTYQAETEQSPLTPELTPELVTNTIDLIFKGVHIKPELIAGVKLNAINKLNPQLAGIIEDSRQLLIQSSASENRLMTPTQLGKQLNLTPQKVNQLLVEKGLQVKNVGKTSRKEPSYLPTDKGHEFCSFTLATGKNNDSTSYQQLLWYESVLSVLS